jgi:cytochrome c-type biogenesis protein CcmE
VDVTPGGRATGPGPDDRDLDDGGLDLSPRTTAAAAPRRRTGGRRWGAIGFLVVLALATGLIVKNFLGDSTLYYKNADEAVAEREELGSDRFRLQGVVVGEPQERTDDRFTRFTVQYAGVSVDVLHDGSEPALFKAGLPVVVEGRWNDAGNRFMSTRLLVKHTEDYEEKDDGGYEEENPDRVQDEQAQS